MKILREAYIRGFRKAAESFGVNPISLSVHIPALRKKAYDDLMLKKTTTPESVRLDQLKPINYFAKYDEEPVRPQQRPMPKRLTPQQIQQRRFVDLSSRRQLITAPSKIRLWDGHEIRHGNGVSTERYTGELNPYKSYRSDRNGNLLVGVGTPNGQGVTIKRWRDLPSTRMMWAARGNVDDAMRGLTGDTRNNVAAIARRHGYVQNKRGRWVQPARPRVAYSQVSNPRQPVLSNAAARTGTGTTYGYASTRNSNIGRGTNVAGSRQSTWNYVENPIINERGEREFPKHRVPIGGTPIGNGRVQFSDGHVARIL